MTRRMRSLTVLLFAAATLTTAFAEPTDTRGGGRRQRPERDQAGERGARPGRDPAKAEPAGPPSAQQVIDGLGSEALDAVLWGQETANPFATLNADEIADLEAHHVDVDRLKKMRAVLILGNYCGANRRNFVNRDPNVILVFGEGPDETEKVAAVKPPPRDPLPHPTVVKTPPAKPEPAPPPVAKAPEPTKARIFSRIPSQRPETSTTGGGDDAPPPEGPSVRMDTPSTRDPNRPAHVETPESKTQDETAKTTRVRPARTPRTPREVVEHTPEKRPDPPNVPDGIRDEKKYDHSFITHGSVYSAGPIVASNYAVFMADVHANDLVWFRGNSGGGFWMAPRSSRLSGAPVVFEPRKNGSPNLALVAEERSFAFTPHGAIDAPIKLAPARERRAHQSDIIEVASYGKPVPNPFTAITAEGAAKLKARGFDPANIQGMKAVLVSGEFCGTYARNFVNNDPNLVLIIGKSFITHGTITSKGPILVAGHANLMNDISGDSVVWFVNNAFPRGGTTGNPVIVAPNAEFSQSHFTTEKVWHGDYGWRMPAGFPTFIADPPPKQ